MQLSLWENVPGVLNTKDNAFGKFLGFLSGVNNELFPKKRWTNAGFVLGPGRNIAWRILDAQYFGVPQRRKRLYLMACPRAGQFDPREILFERKSLPRNIKESKRKKQKITHETGNSLEKSNSIFAIQGNTIRPSAKSGGNGKGWTHNGPQYTLTTKDIHAVFFEQPTWGGYIESQIAPTITANHGGVCHTAPIILKNPELSVYENYPNDSRIKEVNNIMPSITSRFGTGGGNIPIVKTKRIRKLIPIECERLQGFPDNYTKIPYKGKTLENCPNSPRYKAIGNSMAVPVIRWLGERIKKAQNNLNFV